MVNSLKCGSILFQQVRHQIGKIQEKLFIKKKSERIEWQQK